MTNSNPVNRAISPVVRFITIVSGWAIFAYSIALTVEILGRKFFNVSFKGIDELGGFILAVSAAIGACYALTQRSHTRVDVFLVMFPRKVQRFLNTLAMVCFSIFAVYAAWRGVYVLKETVEFQSMATNLEQPLWIPQLAWLSGMFLLAALSLVYAVHAIYLLIKGRPELNAWYGPVSAQEELEAELAELKKRGTAAVDAPPAVTTGGI